MTVDSSIIGVGWVLFQKTDTCKLYNFSYTPCIFTAIEQKLSSTYRELIGIVHSLTIYKLIIFGSNHFINVLNVSKTILSCITQKANLSPIFYTAQRN